MGGAHPLQQRLYGFRLAALEHRAEDRREVLHQLGWAKGRSGTVPVCTTRSRTGCGRNSRKCFTFSAVPSTA